MKKYVTAKLFIKQQFKNDFKKEAENLIAKTRKETGCISHNLFQDVTSEDEFLFFWKVYKSRSIRLSLLVGLPEKFCYNNTGLAVKRNDSWSFGYINLSKNINA